MKLFQVAAATALTLTGAVAAAAGGPLDLSSGSTGFSSTPTAGSFVDVFTFTLLSPFVLTGSITSVVSGTQNVDFTTIVVAGPSGSFNFTLANPDPFEFWVTTSPGFSLIAGNYTLTLSGTNSASIGSYGGNIAVAVPEPQTWALLCGGLGIVGFLGLRRKA